MSTGNGGSLGGEILRAHAAGNGHISNPKILELDGELACGPARGAGAASGGSAGGSGASGAQGSLSGGLEGLSLLRMRARYPGVCAGCGRAVSAGEAVAWHEQSKSIYAHCCMAAAIAAAREGKPLPRKGGGR